MIYRENLQCFLPKKYMKHGWLLLLYVDIHLHCCGPQNINWLISCAHTVQPMNLAWKRQHEELNSWSSRASTKYFFPYRTQFQIIGPHRPASWANRQTGPPFSVCVSLGRTRDIIPTRWMSRYSFLTEQIPWTSPPPAPPPFRLTDTPVSKAGPEI